MRRWAFFLSLGSLLVTDAAQAQTPARTATVRGIVWDSLLNAPLAGARVMVMGTSLGATTDNSGRFRIDSVPVGRRALSVDHPLLDTIGISNLAAAVQVAAGRPIVVELGLPSHWTMRRAACAQRAAPMARDSGLVFGSVQDAVTGARLAGARITVSWIVARRGEQGVEVNRPSVDVSTDSVGNYYACGIPVDLVVTVQAFAGAHQTGVTERLLGPRGVVRHDLSVSRAGTVSVDSVSGLRRGRATLVGIVRQENGEPRPSARVLVDDAQGEVFTNENGRFVLPNMPAGSQMAMVRMIGYTSARVQVDLKDGDTTAIDVTIRAINVLDTIRVTASRWAAGRLDEIAERARTGVGFRLSEEELRDRPTMRGALASLPALTIEGPSAFQFRLIARGTSMATGYCNVNVFIDGRPGSVEELVSYRPEQLITVEYFSRSAQVPPQYLLNANPCAALLVWTRFIR